MNTRARRQGAVRFKTPFVALPDAERNASLIEILADLPKGDPWVFTYGSLMWDRDVFGYRESESALLRGYHRSFCVWTQLARGTPERPGLALGLEAGGACRGIAYRVRRSQAESEFDLIWRREMFTGCYVPRWVNLELTDRRVRAVTFVARREHLQYAGRIAPEDAAFHIAHAHGERGPCREYLSNTLEHLRQLGVRDRGMERLLGLVKRVTKR